MALFDKRTDVLEVDPFLGFRIVHFEHLSFDYHVKLQYPANIMNFVEHSDEDSGDCYIDLQSGEKLLMKTGYLYLIPARHPTAFERSLKTTTYTVHFYLDFFCNCDVMSSFSKPFCVHAPDLCKRIQTIFEVKDRFRADVLLRAFLLECCGRYWPENFQVPAPGLERFAETLQYMESHSSARLTVSELAKREHCRNDVFSRRFEKAFGKTPFQMIREILTRRIAEQLTHDLPLKNLAEQFGFSSEFYLSRFFKKQTGVAPSEYRHILTGGKIRRPRRG